MNNSDELLSAMIVGEVFGNVLVIEPRGDQVFSDLAATVQDVTICQSNPDSALDCDELRSLDCDVVEVTPDAIAGLETQASLLIFDFPEEANPEEFLDMALAKVADDGFVLIDVEIESKSQLGRIQRILEASLSDIGAPEGISDGLRLCLAGRRKATGQEMVLSVAEEPLSVTVLCYVGDDSKAVDELAVSLLFRQSVFPALVIFLDDNTNVHDHLPEDLWGMASQSPTQPALIRTGGIGRAQAYAEGLSHVETDYAILIEPGQMPSPRWAEQLSLALDREAEAGLAFSVALEWNESGAGPYHRGIQIPDRGIHNPYALLLMAIDSIPLGGTVMYRSELLRDLLSKPRESADVVFTDDLVLRATEEARAVNVLMPLCCAIRIEPSESASRRLMETLHERETLTQLIDALEIMPEEERQGMALEIRAEAMLSGGAFDQALSDYKTALALDPTFPELRVEYLVALRMADRADEVVTQVRTWLDESGAEGDIRYSLLLAWGLYAQGARKSARELLLEIERAYPSDIRVILDLLVLDQDEARSLRGSRLIELLKDELPDSEIETLCL